MESQQPARHFRPLVILGLVMVLGPLAPATAVPEARVNLDTDRFAVGSKWTLEILVDAPDPLSVKVTVPNLPAQLALADGPNLRATSWEKTPGTLTRAVKATLTLKTLGPGIVEVGPFEVKIGAALRTLAPVTVYLLAPDEAKRRFPVDLRWIVPPGPVLVGQAVPVFLQARNLDTLSQAPALTLSAPADALWEQASHLGDIEITTAGEDRLMNIPWGGWVVIPTKAGTLTLPPVKTQVAGLDRTAPGVTVEVQPAPAETQTRAVGTFTYSVEARGEGDVKDGRILVVQELTGQGNFPYLELPPVVASGLTLVSRQESDRYEPGVGGYQGSLAVTWTFSSPGRQADLVLPGFQAIRADNRTVDQWDPRPVTVKLDSTPLAAPGPAPDQLLTWAGVLDVRPWPLAEGPWPWVLTLPGALFLASTFLVKGRRRGLFVLSGASVALALFTSALEAPPAGFDQAWKATGTEAADRWASLAAGHPNEPGLWYNTAVTARREGRTAEAVHGFRMALYTGFQGEAASRGLVSLEETEKLLDQFHPWSGPPSSLLILALAAAANLVFVFWGIQRLTGSGSWLPPLALAVVLAAGVGVLQVGAEAARLEPDAVVGPADGPIRKVPGALAEAWMTLKAGTVVRIEGRSDRWRLVRTGYGLEGWVETSELLPLKDRP